jgi:hypothetical protein
VKKLITDYTFIPSTKTIRLNEFASVDLEGLLLITNVSTNQIIYNFADPNLGATAVGNTFVLNYDVTTMSESDALQIYYDIAEDNPLTEELFHLFKRMTRLLQSNAVVDSADRQIVRVSVIDGINSGLINTVQNVSSLNALNGVDPRFLLMDTSRNAYANLIRSKLIS